MTLKLTKFICVFLGLSLSLHFLSAQTEEIGKDAPKNFSWTKPLATELAFKLMNLDGANRTVYVKKADFFAPVTGSARDFSSEYGVAKAASLTFYARKVDPQLPEGTARYIPLLTVNTFDSLDILVATYQKGNTLEGSSLDISLNAMPIGFLTIINLSPAPIGIKADKKLLKLGFFQTYKIAGYGGKTNSLGVSLEIYNLKAADLTVPAESNRYVFYKTQRAILLNFFPPTPPPTEMKRTKAYTIEEAAGLAKSKTTSNAPVNSSFFSNSGPRS